ncbi:hypothetical protein [Paraburkholderia mimosarum]|uniref:hypothetical protein n=1 Tax=Paraburkholderia mimosarum TaxID=312026 RepID=UPI00041855DA|nr:hypothetical protein [Paraburkholderia mimosarum]
MNSKTNAMRTILATLVAGTALAAGGTALADSDVTPRPRYDEPARAPAPGGETTLGWHGDRYWDGHRYWAHDEWMHRHPHDRDTRRDREHEDHYD